MTPGEKKAARVEWFFANHLHLSKDRYAGRPFVLEKWQLDNIVRPVFGTLDAKGRRKYSDVVIGLPRWHGKTELAAGMLLTCAITEPTPGGEYYIVATTRQQAAIAFKAIKTMVQRDPLLASACKPYKNVIEIPELDATIRTMSWDADTAQGFHPTVAIIDEYHVHRDASMREAMLTGMVGSQNGLLITISTAGAKRSGPLWDLLNERKPASRYIYWCGATAEDDPHDPKVWRRCNPAKWITLEQLRKQYRQLPTPVFTRLHLNRFASSDTYEAAIRSSVWMSPENSRKPVYDPELPTYMAVDAADKRDRTAFTIVQVDNDGIFHLWADIREADRDRGYTDYLSLEEDIKKAATEMGTERIAFDRRQMGRSMQQLSDERFPVEEFNQSNENMCAASQFLFELAQANKLRHGGDPNLAEHIANAAAYERPPLGWRFAKSDRNDPTCKIDAAISTAMACWIAQASRPSVYESRGLLTI